MNTDKTLSRQHWIDHITGPGQDYELVPGTVCGRPCRVFKNGPQTLRELFADNRSEKTFLVYQQQRYSFEQVYQRTAQLANVLVSQYGIEKGDRVAIAMRNYPEWVLAFNAITSIGAVAVAMNALWLADEMTFALGDSGAKLLIADQQRLARLGQGRQTLAVAVLVVRPSEVLPSGVADFDSLVDAAAATMPAVELTADDPATLFYTSGSTGHPKGVLCCHRNIVSALMSWELELALSRAEFQLTPPPLPVQPAVLLAIPLFHVTGSHSVMLMSYRAQRKMVSMYKWDVAVAAALIEAESITAFTAPPAMTGDLVEHAKISESDFSSLVTVGGGGAPRAPDQVKKIASTLAAQPNIGWGMTETNAIGAGIAGQDYVNHPGSTGRISAVMDLRIVDETGCDVPSGQSGELLLAGPTVFEGYWNRPEANDEAFAGHFLRTGDVGCVDQQGYLTIVDRIKDLVIRGGENIGCAEVEGALVEHPDIIEASVYAVPDQRLGEEVGATLYCSTVLDPELIRQFLRERVAAFKVPRFIEFSEAALPRIASGKIDKKTIRASACLQWQ